MDDSGDDTPKRRSGTRPKKRKFGNNQYTATRPSEQETPTRRMEVPVSEPRRTRSMAAAATSKASTSTATSSAQEELPVSSRIGSAEVSTSVTPRQLPVDNSTPSTSAASPVSASARKLRSSLNPEVDDSRKCWNGFRVVDVDLFLNSIEENCVCKICLQSVKILETSQCGLSSKFTITCKHCGFTDTFRNSEMLSSRISEVNRRSVYAFKSLGLGYSAFKEFCALMDFPKPIASTTFDRSVDEINEASTEVAKESMNQAAIEESAATGKNNVTVSGDGSWQKRGFTSLFGVVTLIGLLTGKVLDFLVLSLVCKVCDAYKGERKGEDYEEWLEEHAPNCTKNHEGSSGKMEVDGMVNLFKRSEDERGVIYENYIGDGDSKTYLAITKSNPYEDKNILVKKRECTAHVQKRMGTRLRNLKKELSGKKLSDGKGISGKGRLTDKVIDQISEYYGKAIRSSSTVEEMQKKVWAIFYHMSSSDAKPTHQHCPRGADSWCKYQRAVAAKKTRQFKHRVGVPLVCMMACKKVFEDLTKVELLQKCIGGYTQNPNESVNNLIWLRCPKAKFFGKKSVDIAAAEGVLQFNDGCRAKIKVLRRMGVQPGSQCISWAVSEDNSRVTQAQYRAKQTTKEARVARLKKRKEAEQSNEDDSYVPGGH